MGETIKDEWVIKESCAFKLLGRQERVNNLRYKRRGLALGNVLLNLHCYLGHLRR